MDRVPSPLSTRSFSGAGGGILQGLFYRVDVGNRRSPSFGSWVLSACQSHGGHGSYGTCTGVVFANNTMLMCVKSSSTHATVFNALKNKLFFIGHGN